MKTQPTRPHLVLKAIIVLCSACVLHGQGTFQNLNFESAVIVPIPGDPFGHVQFAPAFPGWNATINGQAQTVALYNNFSGSTPSMTLLGPGFPLARYEGNYTAILQTHTISLQAQVSLFQTGLVPSDARSLRFLGTTPAGLFQGTLSVSLGGVPLSLIVLQDFVTNALYAVDITSFAAQNAELRFTDTVGPGGSSDFFLDAITFSPIAVPEPGTWALLGLGSTFFWCAARRRK